MPRSDELVVVVVVVVGERESGERDGRYEGRVGRNFPHGALRLVP